MSDSEVSVALSAWFWLQESLRFLFVTVIQFVLESRVCCFWNDRFLLKDGKDTHWLKNENITDNYHW